MRIVSERLPGRASASALLRAHDVRHQGLLFWLCSQVLRPASGWAQRRWLLLACLGAVIMMGCLWADRALCGAFGSHVNFVHLLFLGCDTVFFAFLRLYRAPSARLGAGNKQP